MKLTQQEIDKQLKEIEIKLSDLGVIKKGQTSETTLHDAITTRYLIEVFERIKNALNKKQEKIELKELGLKNCMDDIFLKSKGTFLDTVLNQNRSYFRDIIDIAKSCGSQVPEAQIAKENNDSTNPTKLTKTLLDFCLGENFEVNIHDMNDLTLLSSLTYPELHNLLIAKRLKFFGTELPSTTDFTDHQPGDTLNIAKILIQKPSEFKLLVDKGQAKDILTDVFFDKMNGAKPKEIIAYLEVISDNKNNFLGQGKDFSRLLNFCYTKLKTMQDYKDFHGYKGDKKIINDIKDNIGSKVLSEDDKAFHLCKNLDDVKYLMRIKKLNKSPLGDALSKKLMKKYVKTIEDLTALLVPAQNDSLTYNLEVIKNLPNLFALLDSKNFSYDKLDDYLDKFDKRDLQAYLLITLLDEAKELGADTETVEDLKKSCDKYAVGTPDFDAARLKKEFDEAIKSKKLIVDTGSKFRKILDHIKALLTYMVTGDNTTRQGLFNKSAQSKRVTKMTKVIEHIEHPKRGSSKS